MVPTYLISYLEYLHYFQIHLFIVLLLMPKRIVVGYLPIISVLKFKCNYSNESSQQYKLMRILCISYILIKVLYTFRFNYIIKYNFTAYY